MTLSDPIASMLTNIRNANMRGHRTVIFPYSSFKLRICEMMKENNFLSKCWHNEKNNKIKVEIKYNNKESKIRELKKISKPSQHVHLNVDEIRKKCKGKSIYFISTSSGLMTHKEAIEKNIGGKAIFYAF